MEKIPFSTEPVPREGEHDTDDEFYRVTGCECDNPFGCNCRYGGVWLPTEGR